MKNFEPHAPTIFGVLAVLLFLPTLSYHFVNYDDPWLIRDNLLLHQLSWEGVKVLWGDFSLPVRLRLGSEYLPLRDLSVMLDYAIYGHWIGGHHLTNALLYGLTCAGLIATLQTWRIGEGAFVWMVGLLYTLHPIHVESVAWLSERKGLLSAAWMFASFLLFYRFAKHRSWPALFGACLAIMLAIWSKAIALMGLPFLGVLLWLYPPAQAKVSDNTKSTDQGEAREAPNEAEAPNELEAPNEAEAPKQVVEREGSTSLGAFDVSQWLGWVAVCVCGVLAFAPVWWVGQQVSMIQGYHGGSWLSNFWLALGVYGTYFQLLFFVGGYGIQYPVAPGHVPLLQALIGGIGSLLILVVGIIGFIRRGPWRLPALAACAWLIFLFPVSQLPLQLQNYIADRYMLLPSLGWTIAFAWLLLRLLSKWELQALTVGVIAVLAGLLTFFQTTTWSSSRALYKQAVRVHPRHIKAMIQLARIESSHRRPQQALYWLARAKKLQPHHPRVLLQDALLQLRQGKLKEAIQTLTLAAQKSQDDKVRANLALLLMRKKRAKEALKWAKEAAKIRPLLVHNQRTLGVVALANNELKVAQKALHKALQLQPNRPQNLINLGVLYQRLQEPDKAQAFFQKARALQHRR